MSCATTVAHRAARQLRTSIPLLIAVLVALAATVTVPRPADAAAYAPRVVIVVGPSGGSTAKYLERARSYARQARAYGARVTELYTPNATWSRVVAASQGANILIYLGHGNGWPSPYAPYQGGTKDGLGLNPRAGSGTRSPVKYYGEDLVAATIRLAPGSVVLLNHLCYASGNGEPGAPNPSWATARKRVDNYAAGFLKAGAAAVLADAHSSLGYEIASLFGAGRSLAAAWRTDADAQGHERTFASRRVPGANVRLDPDSTKAGFYRSLVTRPGASTSGIRIAALRAVTTSAVTLRRGPSSAWAKVGSVADGARVWITGGVRTDGAGRTWAPVTTTTGKRGYIAGWHAKLAGSAVARTNVILRRSPRTTAGKVSTVRTNTRVTILRSTTDSKRRAWLYVRTPGGRIGWMAAWLVRP